MKIGFITTYFCPLQGGVETNIFFLAKELISQGHEVHVFTSDRKGNERFRKEERIERIYIHRYKPLFRYRYYFVLTPGLLQGLYKIKGLDILHVHSIGFFWHEWCAKKYKRRYPKTRLILTPHGPFMALQYNQQGRIIKKIGDRIIRGNVRKYEKIIAVNPKQGGWLSAEYGIASEKLAYVPNGIADRIITDIKKEKAKKQVQITYVGRLNPYKGVNDLLTILPDLPIKVQVQIITSDKDHLEYTKKAIKKECEGRVQFFIGSDDEKKFAILERSHIFVMPSQWEAFSIGILEAMAKGNAIVSTRTEGGTFLVEEGKNGLLYDWGNKEQLKECLLKVCNNDTFRNEVGKNNRKKAEAFVWSKIGKMLEQVYKRTK